MLLQTAETAPIPRKPLHRWPCEALPGSAVHRPPRAFPIALSTALLRLDSTQVIEGARSMNGVPGAPKLGSRGLDNLRIQATTHTILSTKHSISQSWRSNRDSV